MPMGHVSIGLEVQRNTDGDTPANQPDEGQKSLRERLRTHKVFTKDQCFYLNYHKFSIKSFVLDVY